MSATFFDLMRYAQTGIASPEMTHYDKLKALAMCKAGFPVKTLTGVPPISFQSDGTPLTAWSISGNMTQSSVPTPVNPVTPQECGDRTANLTSQVDITTENPNRNLGTSSGLVKALKTLTPEVQYTISWKFTSASTSGVRNEIILYNGSQSLNVYIGNGDTFSLTAEVINDLTAVIAYFGNAGGTMADFMLNTGSTAQPYEPFGYKIDISCGGQTYTAYLQEPIRGSGEYADIAESNGTVTRRFYCYTAKGTNDEGWEESGSGNEKRFYNVMPSKYAAGIRYSPVVICSHFVKGNASYKNGGCDVYNKNFRVNALSTGFTDLSDFTAWLASEYEAGHPVKVWYVMNTAQTETFTAPTITPTKGANTLTVGTTLPPSEVSITGGIK